MKITIGSVLEYLIPNSYYMQLVWAKYLYFYKGNNSCRINVLFFWRNRFFISRLDFIIWACFEKKSSIFPSVSPVAVVCFCTKLSGICTKQNIFCTKTGGGLCMFFRIFFAPSG